MKDQLLAALKAHQNQVDYLEIRLEQREHTSLGFRGPLLDAVDRNFSLVGGVRACHRGGWSFVTFNRLSELLSRVAEAVAQAQLVGQATTHLASVPSVEATVPVQMEKDPRGVSLADKRALLAEYNQLLLAADPRIQTTMAGLSDTFRTVWFVNSTGTVLEQERLDVSGRFGVIARAGDVVRQGFASVHSRTSYGALEGIEEEVLGAAQRAVRQLEAQSVKGGQYTVVLDPYLAGVFIHEAFGHLSEADFIYENPRMQELLQLGKPIAHPSLSVVDDGTVPNQPGSYAYDDEGVPAQRKYLIKDGILTQRLHNLETASILNEQPTGNARALDATHPPLIRMTNTGILPGETSFTDMIKDIEEGIYAVRMLGGQTNGEMFTFAAAEGFMVRHGQLAEPVSDVTLTGNVFQTLQDVDAVGSDAVWLTGGCGKGGQSPLPVAVGGPHIRIKNVVVGGR
ncbi:TldD/PmbA family protein [Candidatus Cyanaurora vandensis]|uniref:TldD/PmbA family protein n=1 Tax=Candidatus Cyanaurora vandensis TaxID=2714958 RepID=UPI00257F7EC0|nr:TldD/PmbA family protein [Candidatus Cyanaurora vandensis]